MDETNVGGADDVHIPLPGANLVWSFAQKLNCVVPIQITASFTVLT